MTRTAQREYDRRYYERNRDRIRERRKLRYEVNREELNKRRRTRSSVETRAAARDKARAHRRANPEATREAVRRYRDANLEKVRQSQARHRRTDGWLRAHRERESRRRAKVGPVDPETKEYVLGLLDEPCAYCGSTENIEVDHVVPLARGGKHEPENLAPACRSCNRSKGAKFLSEWRAA